MGKTKKVVVKPTKEKLLFKVTKRKSVKKSLGLTPKLKKLKKLNISTVKDQIMETITKEPDFNVSIYETDSDKASDDNQSDSEENNGRTFVAAPEKLVDEEQIRHGVHALFEYTEKTKEDKTELFDEEEPIFLQITAIKVPKTPKRQIRFALRHSLLTDSSEICLIVKDMNRTKEHEETIDFYAKYLESQGITNIKTIMPYQQLKTEYGKVFELKYKLIALYDCFLVDSTLSGVVAHMLGKIFLEKRKMPIPVKMNATNLKGHFEKSMRKTAMKMHSKGDSFLLQVGHTKMMPDEVHENVCTVIDDFEVEFPGGVNNIRSLGLKTANSITIPCYLTLKNKSDVDVPVVLAHRPKLYESVTGELSTFYNKDVTVLPTGEVIVKKGSKNITQSDNESADEDEEQVDNEDEQELAEEAQTINESSDVTMRKNKKSKLETVTKITSNKKGKKKVANAETIKLIDENQEQEDDDLLQAEETYIIEYQQQQNVTRRLRTKKEPAITEEKVSSKVNKAKQPKSKVKNKTADTNNDTKSSTRQRNVKKDVADKEKLESKNKSKEITKRKVASAEPDIPKQTVKRTAKTKLQSTEEAEVVPKKRTKKNETQSKQNEPKEVKVTKKNVKEIKTANKENKQKQSTVNNEVNLAIEDTKKKIATKRTKVKANVENISKTSKQATKVNKVDESDKKVVEIKKTAKTASKTKNVKGKSVGDIKKTPKKTVRNLRNRN